jgi:rhodanese-related sulfurtransferase
MLFKKWWPWLFTVLMSAALADAGTAGIGQDRSEIKKDSAVEHITAEELKTRLLRNEPVTILDVRAGGDYTTSDAGIPNAIYVRPRRLQARLRFAPLKDIPRDKEVVVYCACPNDETSTRAAQTLAEAGFTRVRILRGGWQAWQKSGGPVQAKPR